MDLSDVIKTVLRDIINWKWQFVTSVHLLQSSSVRRVFHKCKYRQLRFSCAMRREMVQWNVQPWNAILLHPLISIFKFTSIICCKWRRNTKYVGIQTLAIMPILPTFWVLSVKWALTRCVPPGRYVDEREAVRQTHHHVVVVNDVTVRRRRDISAEREVY